VQVPNSQFFQKSVRRWRGAEVQALHKELPKRTEPAAPKSIKNLVIFSPKP
jgi:hypothetical protein